MKDVVVKAVNGHGMRTIVSEPVRCSLVLLLKAHDYARDAQSAVWDFAIEIHRFRETGASECDLRWLCSKGYIKHAMDVTRVGQKGRVFGPTGSLAFADRSCFALTAKGVRFARSVASRSAALTSTSDEHPSSDPIEHAASTVPCWDVVERILRVNGSVVKHFRVPASNQELVLSTFQEEQWPKHIDDPLSPTDEIEPKRRLHSTIHCLNRNQKCSLIHFYGDGHGTGVCWELVRPGGNGKSNR